MLPSNNNDKRFSNKKVTQFFFIVAILLLGILLFYQLMFMLSAILGAIALFIIMRIPHRLLVSKHNWKNMLATIFLISCSIVVLLLPSYLIVQFLIIKIRPFVYDPEPIIAQIRTINLYIENHFNITLLSAGNLEKTEIMASKILSSVIGSGLSLLGNLTLLYFMLWFMLNNSLKLEQWVKNNSPFKPANTKIILTTVKDAVINNSIGIIVLGFIQGIVAIIGYSIFGVSEPVLWGLLTGAVSVIPFAGTMLIWVPMTILLFANGDTMPGLGLLFYGFFLIGGIDNILRFLLQKRIAQTHPVITVLGVLVGLNLFGFWGLIYGPMMFSLFLILSNIYKNEYSKKDRPDETATKEI